MRKLVLGMVAATIALPTAAAAQPGYYGGYPYGGQQSRYDRNGDGVVTDREIRRTQREDQRRYERDAARGYGSGYGAYGSGYGGAYGSGYGGAYGSGYGAYGAGQYSQYYDRNGYYSGPTWRGQDGRYYCRRSDGTTGTIVGGAAGALIGSQVAGRGDRTLGAIIGGAIGAVIGNSVEKGSSRSRCY